MRLLQISGLAVWDWWEARGEWPRWALITPLGALLGLLLAWLPMAQGDWVAHPALWVLGALVQGRAIAQIRVASVGVAAAATVWSLSTAETMPEMSVTLTLVGFWVVVAAQSRVWLGAELVAASVFGVLTAVGAAIATFFSGFMTIGLQFVLPPWGLWALDALLTVVGMGLTWGVLLMAAWASLRASVSTEGLSPPIGVVFVRLFLGWLK